MREMTKVIQIALLSVLALSAFNVVANATPQGAHGTIALVPIAEHDGLSNVMFNDKPQLIVGDIAIVAIPLFTESGEYPVQLHFNDGHSQMIPIKVLEREYPEERITVTDQEHVTPSESTLVRIREESALMREAYALFTPQPDDLLPIIQPVEGRNSGVFGVTTLLQRSTT